MKFIFLLLVCFASLAAEMEKPIVVVIPSYNNKIWLRKNLDSVVGQNYKNFKVVYIDDNSPDGTGELVAKYIKKKKLGSRIELIQNPVRKGALHNLYHAIHESADESIIVTIDGDDWLPHPDVLKNLNIIYSTKDVWLTHGRFVEYPNNHSSWCQEIPEHIIQVNAFRQFKCASHLRTFYAWLFKKIRKEDLEYEGQFFQMTWDMAMMYPMLEMAGERHCFINDINYVYNVSNPINDNKVDPAYQNFLDRYIRNMPPYERLK